MAMARRRRESAEIEAGAMNDIMFFLFLFFLIVCTTLAKVGSLSVALPSAKTTQKVEFETIQIEYDGKSLLVENKAMSFEEAKKYLLGKKEKLKKDDKSTVAGLSVALVIDKEIKVQEMVDIMQLCASAGIKMSLKTAQQ